jgi:hypothetical protein
MGFNSSFKGLNGLPGKITGYRSGDHEACTHMRCVAFFFYVVILHANCYIYLQLHQFPIYIMVTYYSIVFIVYLLFSIALFFIQ